MHIPSWDEQCNTLPLSFSSYTVNKCLFHSLVYCHGFFPAFSCFWLVLPLFKVTHKYSAEVLSGVLTCKKAVMSLSEKINVLGRLCSGMSYTAVSSMLRNQSHIVNKTSSNRIKQGYALISWWKFHGQRHPGTWLYLSLRSHGSAFTSPVFTDSVFMETV